MATTAMTGTSNGGASQRYDSMYVAHNLIMKFTVSMALKAVLRLGIPDILSNAEGKKALSVEEILAQLPTKSSPGSNSVTSNLKRLLSPMVREGVFSESTDGEGKTVYGLTEVSKWFVKDSQQTLAPLTDFQLSTVLLGGPWDQMHEIILDDTTVPFTKATGLPFWEYCATKDPEFGALFQTGMGIYSRIHNSSIVEDLRQCGVLDGVNILVDVGGCQGAVVAEIVACNPHIQGINFDLPDVIKTAPAVNGVQHVGGSFFDRVPSGDAMFMKFIIHDHGDEDAIKILHNCFKALPKNGKVIIAEYARSKQNSAARAFFIETLDLIMLSSLKGARERTDEEYQGLIIAAGFPRTHLIQNPASYDLIVGIKE
ncbi:unnamed protein product [Calypogeia fissa]